MSLICGPSCDSMTLHLFLQSSEYVFGDNVTSSVIEDLLPGETHVLRLRARNVAGLSEPSNNQTYTPPSAGKCNQAYNIIL